MDAFAYRAFDFSNLWIRWLFCRREARLPFFQRTFAALVSAAGLFTAFCGVTADNRRGNSPPKGVASFSRVGGGTPGLSHRGVSWLWGSRGAKGSGFRCRGCRHIHIRTANQSPLRPCQGALTNSEFSGRWPGHFLPQILPRCEVVRIFENICSRNRGDL